MKDVLWECYENFITVVQAFILIRFISSLFGLKYQKKYPLLTYMIGTFMYGAVVIMTNYIVGFEGLGIIIFAGVIGLYGIVFLNGKWYGKVPVAMMEMLATIFSSTVVSMLVCVITGIDGTRLADTPCMERFVALIATQIVLLFCLEAMGKVINQEWYSLTKGEWKIFLLIFLTSLIIFFCITQALFTQEMSENNKTRLLGASIGLILLNIICFYMLNDLVRKRKVETENLLLKEQTAYQEKYVKEVKQQHDEVKRIRHDMKQHYCVLENLLMEEKYDRVKEYLSKFIKNIEQRDSFFYMKNEYVNAILNRKINQAKEAGIIVRLNSVQELLGIDEMDMCNLLGNLLDNAIEACGKVKENKYIDVILSQDADKIYVEMKNSIAESILKEGKIPLTGKKNKENHGFGIKSVRKIVKKYDGMVDFSEEGKWFYVNLVLYVPK